MEASNPVSDSSLLDRERLDTFLVIGIDYQDLLNDVVQEVPPHLAEIRNAIQQGNRQQLKSLAHSLRGPLAYCGCIAITTRLAELEIQATLAPDQFTLAPEHADTIHDELQSLWERSLAAIKVWEQSVAAPPP